MEQTVSENTRIFDLLEKKILLYENRFSNWDFNDFNMLYSYFAIDSSNNIRRRGDILKAIENKLRYILQKYDIQYMASIIRIVKQYYIYMYLSRREKESYFYYMHILDSTANQRKYTDNIYKLKEMSLRDCSEVCRLLVLYKLCDNDSSMDIHFYLRLYDTEVRYADAIIQAARLVKETKIVYGNIENIDEVTQILFNRIENKILRYGCRRFYENVINKYMKTYMEDESKFVTNINSPRVFLYRIAIKQLTCNPDVAGSTGCKFNFELIEHLAIVLLEIQGFSSVATDKLDLLLKTKNPQEYIYKVIGYDTIYRERQYDPLRMLLFIEYMLKKRNSDVKNIVGMDLELFISISRIIIEYALEKITHKLPNDSLIVNPLIIYERGKKQISLDAIEKYFQKMVTVDPINQNWKNLYDLTEICDDSTWLVGAKNGNKYDAYIPLPSIDCFGLWDKVQAILGYKNQGYTFEECVREWINDRLGIEVISGKYILNNKVFESDGILVYDNIVIFIECKTKVLTRKARSLNLYNLIMDLSDSVMKSCMQAFRCELSVRENNFKIYDSIVGDTDLLKNNNGITPIKIIKLQPNTIYFKLSVVPFSYGILNEKVITNKILEILMYNIYINPQFIKQEKINSFNRNHREYIDIIKKIYPIYNNKFEDLIRNTHFLTIDILYELLNQSNNCNEFVDYLKKRSLIQFSGYETNDNMKAFLNKI